MSDSAWPGLGFNPAKGSVKTTEWLAHDVGRVADELEELHRLVEQIGKSDKVWKGEAATAFRGQLGKLPTYLQQGSKSMHDCSHALKQWRENLHAHQETAKRLENDAVAARSKVKETVEASKLINQKIDDINHNHVQISKAEADKLTSDSSKAASDAAKAVHALDLIIAEAERLREKWERHSEEAAKAIREAAKNHPPDISVWERISGGLNKAWKGFKNFLVKHADLFSTLSSALALAAIVASAFPPAGVVLGGLSVACASAAAAGHYMAWKRGLIDGKTTIAKVGMDSLGLFPGFGAGNGLFQGVKAGAKGAKLLNGAREAGTGFLEAFKNPLTTKGISPQVNRVAGMFKKEVSPEAITGTVKAMSTVHGLEKLLTHGETSSHHEREPRIQAPAPYTGRRGTPAAFHEALAG
ncbi:putative T7SS-secreted protein [Streptomyces sp. CA-181903]|uniref:putative T7SS-secreted protein n=1 Tax=Streptomyces sp. CA-181903 TaxID=3240055 RepID=UPI003D8A00BB